MKRRENDPFLFGIFNNVSSATELNESVKIIMQIISFSSYFMKAKKLKRNYYIHCIIV